MKVSCEIIKDLIPLYKDEICSTESKTLIEEHISNCKDCKNYLNEMNVEIFNNIDKNLDEAKELKNISKKWRNSLIKSLLKGFIIAIAIIAILFIFMDFRIISK